MQKLVVLSGAGISAESGLSTFRDNGGLWDEYNVYKVATPEAWEANPELVLEFYNKRRKQMISVQPNVAHKEIAALEEKFIVNVITQNIDDLHERAGSSKILHLHGELINARSSKNAHYKKRLSKENIEIKLGDLCPEGRQLRPDVVWFGEAVPAIDTAIDIAKKADTLLIIGTSLQVYPAASLVMYVPQHCKIFVIDPKTIDLGGTQNVTHIKKGASEGIEIFKQHILAQ